MRVPASIGVFALLVSCGPPREKVAACESALSARLAAIQSSSAALDAAESDGAARLAAADKAIKDAEKRLAKLTIPYSAVLSYPDRMKERIAAGKMRFVSATPIRAQGTGTLKSLRYDIEFNGDYRAVSKTVRSLYEQPVALFFDRIEVNITDEYKKQATVKAQVYVHEMPKLDRPAGGTPSPAWTAASANAPIGACEGVKTPLAEQVAAARAALEGRREAALVAGDIEAREGAVKERTDLAEELLRKRDDNRALFTSRADELVEKAKGAVAGFAELRFSPTGDPVWR